jgi:processive 1,2-diacylglycerol beta-glucosyltransferase
VIEMTPRDTREDAMERTTQQIERDPIRSSSLDRVLILSASAGAGHVRAAQALEQAFRESGAAREVRHVDALDHVFPPLRRIYGQGYLELVTHAPAVLGWLYDALDQPGRHARLRSALDTLTAGPLARLLERADADWVVCTHFLPAAVASDLKARGRLRSRLAVVVTDFDAHALWLVPHVDRYFVALEATRRYLAHLGVPAERITVSGIPIDPVFTEPRNAVAMTRKHGLDPARRTILVTAGGFGVGPVERLVRSLLELRRPAQLVVICGRSAELKRRLDDLAAAQPVDGSVTLRVLGYTRAMDEYMAAADLLVGKPGGLTTAEALARGLPMVIVNPIPGQEERNADHLLEAGAAIRCNNLPALAWKLDRLLDDPGRLAAMRTNARRLARPRAASEIAKSLLAT